jgi:serine/threonine protein kinase
MSRVPLPPAEPMKLARLAEIARGGMGSVELARVEDGRLKGQIVAVKRLHPNIASDPQFVSMFLDEAWLTAALHHVNVVAVAAWGDDDRGMFLAIEFVQGVSLQRLLKESKVNKEMFAERTVANLCSQICAGLTAAHHLRGDDGAMLGLVHRDLTPGNVLVTFDGLVKIVDFGIAKAEERISHTRTGTLKGKPAYMAPEQARGGKVDARADIFSFGVLMFELLAGRRPWTAKAAFDVMMEIAGDPPPKLSELRPALNPEFIAIVEKCLEKKPEDRFSSAEEIQARLDAWRVQKGFTSDDQQSLAAFVVRNSDAQIAWYQAALRGDFIKVEKAESFKDLEEKIDAQREDTDKPKKKPPPLRPAAGRPAPPPPAAGRPATPSPAAGRPATPAPADAAPPASGPSPGPSPEAPAPTSSPAVSTLDASPASRLLAGAGTEYMVMSPFATGEIKLPTIRPPPSKAPPPAPPPPPGATTTASSFGSGVHAAPSSNRAPDAAFGSGVHAGPPASMRLTPTADPRVSNVDPRPVAAPPAAAATSNLKLVIMLLLIALISAGSVVAWQMVVRKRALSPPPPSAPPIVAEPAPAAS